MLCFLFCFFSFVVGVVRLRRSLVSQETYKFIANHPFIFVIHERRTDLTLFIGRCMKPTAVAVHHTELWLCICFEFVSILGRGGSCLQHKCRFLQAINVLSCVFISSSDNSKRMQVAVSVSGKLWQNFKKIKWQLWVEKAGGVAVLKVGCSIICKFTFWGCCLGNWHYITAWVSLLKGPLSCMSIT